MSSCNSDPGAAVRNTPQPAEMSDGQLIFLNEREAAALLRISPITLRRWRIEGRGPEYRKFGRRVLYASADLMHWADDQRRQSTSADPHHST